MPTDHENDARIAREKAEAEAKAAEQDKADEEATETARADAFAAHEALNRPPPQAPFLNEYGN